MKFHHLALKEARGKLLGLMLILGALWLLGMEVGSTEATMHWGNPCFARGNPLLRVAPNYYPQGIGVV